MKTLELQAICQKFVKNFPGKVSISLLKNTTREEKGGDIDLLFEIPSGVFLQYFIDCDSSGINFIDGSPKDSTNHYWKRHSSKEIHFVIIRDNLRADELLMEEIPVIFRECCLESIVLPFGWREDDEVLGVISRRDPSFSRKLELDVILVFEK